MVLGKTNTLSLYDRMDEESTYAIEAEVMASQWGRNVN